MTKTINLNACCRAAKAEISAKNKKAIPKVPQRAKPALSVVLGGRSDPYIIDDNDRSWAYE